MKLPQFSIRTALLLLVPLAVLSFAISALGPDHDYRLTKTLLVRGGSTFGAMAIGIVTAALLRKLRH